MDEGKQTKIIFMLNRGFLARMSTHTPLVGMPTWVGPLAQAVGFKGGWVAEKRRHFPAHSAGRKERIAKVNKPSLPSSRGGLGAGKSYRNVGPMGLRQGKKSSQPL